MRKAVPSTSISSAIAPVLKTRESLDDTSAMCACVVLGLLLPALTRQSRLRARIKCHNARPHLPTCGAPQSDRALDGASPGVAAAARIGLIITRH
ncbi:hypothetical protein EVAR_22716_1 [Eumeta japonica]|uniref:Uncharacterized protein n=1 Tax=Eumeta variegata TaxID=151549 RepID=A0A4C1UU54_EUMVA|nr:hypothetical protein EVAR_22716_1 [Eumeta japonica]